MPSSDGRREVHPTALIREGRGLRHVLIVVCFARTGAAHFAANDGGLLTQSAPGCTLTCGFCCHGWQGRRGALALQRAPTRHQ